MNVITTTSAGSSFSSAPQPAAPEVRARSLYSELRAEGLTERDMMTLVGELMGLVTAEMRSHSEG